jgi:hypothetical protein
MSDTTMRRIGLAMSGLVIAFMIMDGGMKLPPLDITVTTTAALGYPASPGLVRGIGLLGLGCTVLYALPRTAVLGAVLLTAYMGGAVATHARVGSPLFSHVLFGVYLGALLWGGLYLRDPRVRTLLPWRVAAGRE